MLHYIKGKVSIFCLGALVSAIFNVLIRTSSSAEIQSPIRVEHSQIERGRYLVNVAGCGDCHTPGHLFGKPDDTRLLGGSDVAFEVAGLGVFVPPNLTPDPTTGLGAWSRDEIVTAVTTGVRPDGRVLAPIMPWRGFAILTKADANAIADYLLSLPPVSHKVPGPFGPGEKPEIPIMKIVSPDAHTAGGAHNPG